MDIGYLKKIGLFVVMFLFVGLVQAQSNLPPIHLIVGYSPGGPVDAAARLFAPYFSKEISRTVIVENRPGASGALAGDMIAKSDPDGTYIFFAASPTMTITPYVLKNLTFNPSKDLVPIAPILSYTNILVINKDLPIKKISDLIAYAKANPGKVTYGSAGMGASNHLSGELLAKRAGVMMTHVPYKGNAPAMTDVMGGQIMFMFDIVGSARNYIQSNKVFPLAVTSKDRNSSLPDVPTMQESGVSDYDVGGWYGLYGPLKMSSELIAKYNDATRRTLANADLKSKLIEQGYDLWLGSPKTLGDRASKELELWGSVTKGIKFD